MTERKQSMFGNFGKRSKEALASAVRYLTGIADLERAQEVTEYARVIRETENPDFDYVLRDGGGLSHYMPAGFISALAILNAHGSILNERDRRALEKNQSSTKA